MRLDRAPAGEAALAWSRTTPAWGCAGMRLWRASTRHWHGTVQSHVLNNNTAIYTRHRGPRAHPQLVLLALLCTQSDTQPHEYVACGVARASAHL